MSSNPEENHLPDTDQDMCENPDTRPTGTIPKRPTRRGSASDIDTVNEMMADAKVDLTTHAGDPRPRTQPDFNWAKYASQGLPEKTVTQVETLPQPQGASATNVPEPAAIPTARTYAQVTAANTATYSQQPPAGACTTTQSLLPQMTTLTKSPRYSDPRVQVTMTKPNVHRNDELYARQLEQAQRDMYEYQQAHQQSKARWQQPGFTHARQPAPIITTTTTETDDFSADDFQNPPMLERTQSFRKMPRKVEMKPSQLDKVVKSPYLMTTPRLEVGTPNENNIELRKETVLHKEEMLDTQLSVLNILKRLNADADQQTAKMIEDTSQSIMMQNEKVGIQKSKIDNTNKMANCYAPCIKVPELYEFTDYEGYQTKELLQPKQVKSMIDTFNPDDKTDTDFSAFWDRVLVYTRNHKLDEQTYINLLNLLVRGSASRTLIELIKADSSLEEILKTMNDLYSQTRTIINEIDNLNRFKRKPGEPIRATMRRALILADKVKPMYNILMWEGFKKNEILNLIAKQVLTEKTRHHIETLEMQNLRNGTELGYASLVNEIENFETTHNEVPQHEKSLVINVCTGSVIAPTLQKAEQIGGPIEDTRKNPMAKNVTGAINKIAKQLYSITNMDLSGPSRKRIREDDDPPPTKPQRPTLKPHRSIPQTEHNFGQKQENQNRFQTPRQGPPQQKSPAKVVYSGDNNKPPRTYEPPKQGGYNNYPKSNYNNNQYHNGFYPNRNQRYYNNSQSYRGSNYQRRGGPVSKNYDRSNYYGQRHNNHDNSFGQNSPKRYDNPNYQRYNYRSNRYYDQPSWRNPPRQNDNEPQRHQKNEEGEIIAKCPTCTNKHKLNTLCPKTARAYAGKTDGHLNY